MKTHEAKGIYMENIWVYTPIMANIDEQSVLKVNNSDNTVNAYGVEKVPGGLIRISFLRYDKVTGEHVDEYTIVSQVTYRTSDAEKLAKLINETIKGE
jgi:hypothetical protein